MKPRKRNLSNLYFRWGRAVGLDAEEVSEALEGAGLIERLGPDQYRETEQRPKIPARAFEKLVSGVLAQYLANHKGGPL